MKLKAWVALFIAFSGWSALRADSSAWVQMLDRGQYQELGSELDGLSSPTPFELRLRLEVAIHFGEEDRARTLARNLLSMHRSGALSPGEEAAQAAYAAWKLDRWEDANRIFIEVSERSEPSLSMLVDWGHLFLEKYNAAEAEEIFQEAVQAGETGSRWNLADAWVGIATAISEQGRPGVSEAIERAEALDADNLALLQFRARTLLVEENWDEAIQWIDRGLRLNPAGLNLLSLKAAAHHLREEEREFEGLKSRILQTNSRYGDLFELLGDLSVATRRLEPAVEWYREALQRNPNHWRALASKGINLLRLGMESEGHAALERAYENDPYNIWTVNTLRLIDSFDRFDKIETDRFSIRVHQKEAEVLRPYVHELLVRSLETLEEKYGHRVDGKVIFEMYSDHEDFAVRTLGLPGLGALGATFGRVVAMDSPSARPRGAFHWGSTLWHEMAHIVTLSLSDSQVPRWLTEGLSMMEERLVAEGWGDGLNPNFVRAYQQDRLLPLSDLNSGFIRPRFPGQVELSYFQAGWLCEFLVERYGFEKIPEMLRAYGRGMESEQVFLEILGETVDSIDAAFREELAARLDPLIPTLAPEEEGSEAVSALVRSVDPNNYYANLSRARELIRQEALEEAIRPLERAIELFPYAAGQGSPYELLADVYRRLDRPDNLVAALESWWKRSPKSSERAEELARMLAERDRREEAVEVLKHSMFSDPFSEKAHQLLGRLLLELDRPQEAVVEFQVRLAMQPVDEATARFDLAQALMRNGDREAARRQVLLALEIAPRFSDAQALLLEIVRQ